MAVQGRLSADALGLAESVGDLLPDGPIAVALSGGADSAVLAWAVLAARPTARAIAIDHGLAVSASLMEAATSIARLLGIGLTIIPVASVGETETALRSARLAALEAAVEPGEVIATGHTSDDVAETVLGNVLRGTGTAGLGGIPLAREGFIRPLLHVSRATTRAVALELELPFHDDPTNRDLAIRRSRLRHETIPRLAAEYNPQLGAALHRLGRAATSDDEVLERRAARVPVRVEAGVVRIPAAALQTLPRAVASRVVRTALRGIRGPHGGTAAEIESVLAVASGGRVTLGSAVDAIREGAWVVLVKETADPPRERRLVLGETVGFGEWTLGVERGSLGVGRFSALVDDAAQLVVRTARSGDRIAVGGGSKAVADAFAEAGVSPRLRHHWPVVASGGTIAWIPGVRVAPIGGGGSRLRIWARRTS